MRETRCHHLLWRPLVLPPNKRLDMVGLGLVPRWKSTRRIVRGSWHLATGSCCARAAKIPDVGAQWAPKLAKSSDELFARCKDQTQRVKRVRSPCQKGHGNEIPQLRPSTFVFKTCRRFETFKFLRLLDSSICVLVPLLPLTELRKERFVKEKRFGSFDITSKVHL